MAARSNIGSTRIVAANYGSLISAITPAAFRRFLPEQAAFEERTHVLSSCTTDTPLGTIHHSGSGLIFDLNKRSVETQTDPPPDPPPLTWASLDGDYLDDRPALVQEMFGFRCFSAAESFFTATWPDIDLDEPGFAYPSRLTMFDEYLLSLWRMRTRMAERVIGSFAGLPSPQQAASKVVRRWIPRLGQAGRALIWAPSTHYLERSCPPSFQDHGMERVAYIGDASDLLTETVRKEISVRNQQRSDKSHHSAAMGVSWCTPSGWTAICSDLVLGRSSEYNTSVSLGPKFSHLPPDWALCYDKGVASLRAHLPNLNNVIVPCFLSGGQYTAEQAIRNRSIATNRYVIEITYARVKAWDMLSPIIPRHDFDLLNDVWWWAQGFANLTYQPLKRPSVVDVHC